MNKSVKMNDSISIHNSTNVSSSLKNLTQFNSDNLDVYSAGWTEIILITLFGLMACTNVCGNMLTIAAFIKTPALQITRNMYVINLAVTDLLVGFISLPFYSVYTLRHLHWPFSRLACKFYLFIDYTACTESALSILLIAYDRYCLVTQGLHYASLQTTKKAFIRIFLSWLFSICLYGPGIFIYDIIRGESDVEDGQCYVEFANDSVYTIIATLLDFIPPLIGTSVFGVLILRVIIKQAKLIAPFVSGNSLKMKGQQNKSKIQNQQETVPATGNNLLGVPCSNKVSMPSTSGSSSGSIISQAGSLSPLQIRQRKAAKSLSILTSVFAVCWFPFIVTALVYSFCKECVQMDIYEGLACLLWLNSSINPFLYALTNKGIRKAFKEILSCGQSSM